MWLSRVGARSLPMRVAVRGGKRPQAIASAQRRDPLPAPSVAYAAPADPPVGRKGTRSFIIILSSILLPAYLYLIPSLSQQRIFRQQYFNSAGGSSSLCCGWRFSVCFFFFLCALREGSWIEDPTWHAESGEVGCRACTQRKPFESTGELWPINTGCATSLSRNPHPGSGPNQYTPVWNTTMPDRSTVPRAQGRWGGACRACRGCAAGGCGCRVVLCAGWP